jgi:outer membrane protein OmpA-like peptidoglycan-associated protein
MRNRHLFSLLSILLAAFLVSGCGSARQLTKGDMDQVSAISGKIAQAEGMTPGAKTCAPKELAIAKADLDGARHEATESWEDFQAYFARADKSADTLLAKTKACQPPVLKFSANPAEIAPGKCSTLAWSSTNVKTAKIDQGVGDVAASGSKEVCPTGTTQYLMTAVGTGGTVYEEATVTVTAPAPPPPPPPPPAMVPAPVPAPAPAPAGKVIDRLTIRVNFDTAKSDIRKADTPELEKAASFVKKYPDSKVSVEGHTDSRGNDKYNLKLSQQRADAVKKYLVDKGEKADRITAVGKGEAEPVGDNKTKQGQFQNRRVEVLIISE